MIDNNVKEFLIIAQKNLDPITGERLVGGKEQIDFHHAKAHNTEGNRKKYPLLIDSAINLVAVTRSTHDRNPSFGKADDEELMAWEKILSLFLFLVKEKGMSPIDLKKFLWQCKYMYKKHLGGGNFDDF